MYLRQRDVGRLRGTDRSARYGRIGEGAVDHSVVPGRLKSHVSVGVGQCLIARGSEEGRWHESPKADMPATPTGSFIVMLFAGLSGGVPTE